MPLNITVTTAGRAALVNAANTGTAPVTIAQIGLTATAVVPAVGMTVLAGEFKRVATIGGDVVADDVIHVSMLDESADAYTLRSFGLYLQDGTLFAIYGQAGPILEKTASSFSALAIDVIFADIDAALLTFGDTSFMVPSATTERQGVVELATVAEAQLGIDALRALTPESAKAAILGWLLTQDGSGCGLDSDLLDGQHGSWYADIAARLGYTPANKAGDVFGGTVTVRKTNTQEVRLDGGGAPGWRLISSINGATPGSVALQYSSDQFATNFVNALIATVAGQLSSPVQGLLYGAANDGAGSGLDADYLRGLSPDQVVTLARVIAALGYTPLNQDTYTAANVLAKLLTVDGSGSGLDSDLLDGQDSAYYTNIVARLGYTPLNQATYTAANVLSKLLTVDGAGSGVDADTVDGFHAASFARPTTNNLGATGERIYADGFKKCWGQITVGMNSSATVTLPFTFSAVPRVIVGASSRSSTTDQENGGLLSGSETVSSFTIVNGFDFAGTFPWEAFGQ